MTSIYDGDPRVQWASNEVFYLPHHGCTIHFNKASQRWDAYDRDGCVYEPASYRSDFDDAIAAIIGEPLWQIEAQMLAWAAGHDDWLDAYTEWVEDGADIVQQPDPSSWAGIVAVTNLLAAEMLAEQYAGPHVAGYLLTNRGRDLAATINGLADSDVQAVILVNVPQDVMLQEAAA